TLSEPYKNRVYVASGFFTSSLRRSGYGGSSASTTSTHTGPTAPKSLKDSLAEKDAWAEEHLRCTEEMQRQTAAFYNHLRLGSSTIVGWFRFFDYAIIATSSR
ncbi:hypothetical protein PIB30_091318, partial [Stylosanthes scabra]|nr:hypothetical protein [Stylosanthes scabra]